MASARPQGLGPNVRPRLVAMDLDDTLLEKDQRITAATVERVREAQSQGVRVVIATGRMFESALPYAKQLGIDGYLVTYNGGLVRRMDGETLWHKPVPVEGARAMVQVAKREGFALNLFIDDHLYVEEMDDRIRYYMEVASVKATPVGDLADVLDKGEPTKCLFVGEAASIEAAVPRLQKEFPKLQIARSKPRYIEVTRQGIRKEVGLAAVAEEYGIPSEAVMAIGDGDNDTTMIGWAGWGVAVANASAGAKEAADAVTKGLRGAGVREALERFVLHGSG